MVELDRHFRSLGLLPHWQWVLLQRDCGDGATHGAELESEEVGGYAGEAAAARMPDAYLNVGSRSESVA